MVDKYTHITPLHIISLLDPKTEWIKPWINNKTCLTLFIEYFMNEEKNINIILRNIFYYYNKFFIDNNSIKENNKISILSMNQIYIHREYINYLYFIQNIVFLMKISSSFQGKNLFPLNCNNLINNDKRDELNIKQYCYLEKGF